MLNWFKTVFWQIFLYQKSINRRRRAKGRYVIFLYKRQNVSRRKSAKVVICEYRAAGYPLSVNLAPAAFCPTCFRHGKMQSVVLNALPILCIDYKSDRVGIFMRNHFRVSGSSGSKIYKHSIVVCIITVSCKINVGIFKFFLKINKPVTFGCRKVVRYRFANSFSFVNVFNYIVFICTKEHFYVGIIRPICNIFCRKQKSCRYNYSAVFMCGNCDNPIFVSSVKHSHNKVPSFKTVLFENIACFIS